ncbi:MULTISPECIES: hypothetical protein [Sphingomonas]|uniref:hypothetical protein n=1 Tax=Sphingomonas TaxID=13687 RepID=UPI000DEED1E8|nr:MULTISPECIES: hypothetical protein [Sphingomonas]
MKTFNRMIAATALAATTATTMAAPVEARTHHSRHYSRGYHGRTAYGYAYKTCRHSNGTAGLIAGGVGGALLGRGLLGHGLLGTAAGAVGGAFAGRAIDRSITAPQRCYYYR